MFDRGLVMNVVFIVLIISVGLSKRMVSGCPKQCKCGKTYRCSVKDLRTLKAFLPYNVTKLDLSSQGITKVPDGSFINYTALVYLSLANNSIRSLSKYSFLGLQNLQELHLEHNGKIQLDEKVFSYLRSLKRIHLEGNQMNTLPAGIFNLNKTINITKETKKENIHCNFYKKPLTECIRTHIPKCKMALDLKEDELAKFDMQGCAHAQCEVKETGKNIECYMASGNVNETTWSILGDNSAVKLALWTFGLLAVTSNFLVLLTLVCNNEARKSALCVFVMNLLLGNILIGIYIVIFSVSDTLTYGKFNQYGEGRWENQWCLPLFFVKTIGLMLVVLSLLLVSIERILVLLLNSPRHIDCCRSVGYVIESWLFAGVAAIVLWTKTSSWGYLCSTHANSNEFIDINKGIKLSLFGVCVVLLFLYIILLCRTKAKDYENSQANEYRTTVRMFVLLLSTFIFWAAPYMVMIFVVPRFLSVTVSMQTLAISLTVNACLHPFIYSYDNDNLENLYSALACKRDSCLLVPLAVQGQWYKEEEKARQELELELGSLHQKKSLENISVAERKQSCQYSSETCARVSPIDNASEMIAVRGSEVSKAEGAVIIRNKSPTGSNFKEDCSILVHSTPSSPTAPTRNARPFIDEHSECGTLSSDTTVTWISSDCQSHAHARIGDGNSTTSSRASSIPFGKSAASPRIPRKRLSSVKSDSEKSEDDESYGRKSPPTSIAIPVLEEESKDDKQEQADTRKDSRPMSPVEKLFRVLSPKMRNKRPKTDEGLPGASKSTQGPARGKRSKSMLVGKEAKSTQVEENVLDPLPPVTLRDKNTSGQVRDKRNGVFVVGTEQNGQELSIPSSPSEEKDVKTKPVSFSVGKPVNSKSMIRLSNKDKKKRKLNRSFSEPVPKVRIYENPVADFENNNQTDGDVMSGEESVPTSPTRVLAKLEEGDTVPELPKVIKPKCRNSTSSTSSSLRLSGKSLEWDPSYVDETYSDALPPPPTAPPNDAKSSSTPPSSPRSSSSSDKVECNIKMDQVSWYSLEWDPTGVQMRLSVISHESNAGASPEQSEQASEPTIV